MKDYNDLAISNKKIRLSGIIFTIYVAITPIHQALLTSHGGTVNKYVAILLMGVICIENYLHRQVWVDRNIFYAALPFMLYIAATMIWSLSITATQSNVVTLYSDFILLILCCSREWSVREKMLIRYALIIACIYYAYLLLTGMQTTSEWKRTTISFGMEDTASDQNLLAANVGVSTFFAFDNMYKTKKKILKIFNIVAIVWILFGIVATGSRGGLISTVIPLVFLIWKSGCKGDPRKLLWLIVGVGIFIYIFEYSPIFKENIISRFTDTEQLKGNSGRSEIWQRYFKVLNRKPYYYLFGCGLGASFKLNVGAAATHNDIVDLLVTTGIIGLGAMVKFVSYIAKKAITDENVLGIACIIALILAGLSLNTYTRYGFWNLLMFAFIGV